MTSPLRLGLIGDHIDRSRSPRLHRLAGVQTGREVRYDRLVPRDLGRSFEEVFADCVGGGYRGINITYPYKERVTGLVRIDDPLVRAVGAVNTVLFEPEGPLGANTDRSGFVAAYRQARPDRDPGPTLIVGTGGVGRAIAFGLLELGCPEIRLVDRDPVRCQRLATDLGTLAPKLVVVKGEDAASAATGAAGLINATPLGMTGHEGSVLPREAMAGAEWAFDAVYTPVQTRFLSEAAAQGVTVLSGWELFFHQGVHAWDLFTGLPLDEGRLRNDLMREAT